jgi:predicted lipid-binding transport protein (Tim44 family)
VAQPTPEPTAEAVPELPSRALPDPSSPAGQAMAQMKRIDRNFAPARFLEGAEAAFRMIVAAFAGGDRVALRSLLGEETYKTFEAAIAAREEAGQEQRTEVRAIPAASIEQAELTGTRAEITVKFVSDQVSSTVDRAGNYVSGSDAVTEIVDTWTFQRDLSQSDPAWRLVRTA